jgi:hypothetical protein
MEGLKGITGLKAIKGVKRSMPKAEGFSVFKRGPDWVQPLIGDPEQPSVFWPPPVDFDTSSTSNSEWPPYAGLWILFGGPIQFLRKAPYIGMPGYWTYQTFAKGHNYRGHTADYMITPSSRFMRKLIIRLQTEQYHNFTTTNIQQQDRALRAGLGRFNEVVDLSDDQFLWDKSGRAIMYFLRLALSGRDPKVESRVTGRHLRRSRTAR